MGALILIIFFVLLLLIYNSFIYIGILKAFKQNNFTVSETAISIVIAAKNEEDNIPFLIKSLNDQIYSKDLYEVIIVDDNSSDNTFKKVAELISDKPNFAIIKADNKTLPGKKGALTIGIEKAKHDFILITDADCVPQNGWLDAYSKKFSSGFDLIFGIAPFFQKKSPVNYISCFENLRSSLLTFASVSFGFPYSAAARNFGFKKSSFHKLEGYSKTMQTLSGDDDLLIREAYKYKMKTGFVTNKESFVYSSTKENIKDYLQQKARHTKTSLHYLPIHKIFLGVWHLLNLFFLFSPLLIFIDINFLLLFILKIITDIATVTNFQSNFSYKFNPFEIFYLQILYEIFIVINFFNALKGKSDWKVSEQLS